MPPRDSTHGQAPLSAAEIFRHARSFRGSRRHQETDHASSSLAAKGFSSRDRIRVVCSAFDSLAPASSPSGLPVYVARLPPAPFYETQTPSASVWHRRPAKAESSHESEILRFAQNDNLCLWRVESTEAILLRKRKFSDTS